MSSPPVAVATFSPSRVSHAGGTASGFQARILDHCRAHGVEISTSKARKLGVRIARRAERQQQEHDFYTALRVLGIYDDDTARVGEHRASCTRSECGVCGRKGGS